VAAGFEGRQDFITFDNFARKEAGENPTFAGKLKRNSHG
jgi:hypothetical protein